MSAVDDRLALAHRRQAVALRSRSLRDALALWALLDPEKMTTTFPTWLAAQSALIRRDNARSAALAASYLKAARLASGVPGSPEIRMGSELPPAQIAAAMQTTARAGYYTALRYGRTPEQARQVALVKTLGSTGRLILAGGRDTVRDSLSADRKGRGWRRITGPKACDFCVMLAGRGAVYSAESVDFAAHDHCACTAAAVYSDRPIEVREYAPSTKFRTAEQRNKNNAGIRAYLAS